MRLPRMTTRRWTVLILILGIALRGWIQVGRWRDLREQYEFQAEWHQELAENPRQFADRTNDQWRSDCGKVDERNKTGQVMLAGHPAVLSHPPDPATARRLVDRYLLLSRKYERAARYPWLPVEPDTPVPPE